MIKSSDALKEAWQPRFQALRDLFKIHKRNIPYPAFNAAIVRPMEATSLCCFLLINSQLLANATNGPTKPNADIERH
jgi:hypothetical protein